MFRKALGHHDSSFLSAFLAFRFDASVISKPFYRIIDRNKTKRNTNNFINENTGVKGVRFPLSAEEIIRSSVDCVLHGFLPKGEGEAEGSERAALVPCEPGTTGHEKAPFSVPS